METGGLPTSEESLEARKEFNPLKESGLYQPIIGGAKTAPEDGEDDEEGETPPPPAGRPEGSGGKPQEVERAPSDNQNAAPSMAEQLFSLEKIKNNLLLANTLNSQVEKSLRDRHSIKRLTNKQKEVAQDITALIVANEAPENWSESIGSYLDSPIDRNKNRINKINEIAIEHQVDSYLASILYSSKKD